MPIEICTIGGFSRTEGNSVAIKVDDEVLLLDMGLGMEDFIKHQEDREDVRGKLTYKELQRVNAVPNYDHINDWKDLVIGIVPSHGHLDHVGAIPFAATLFPTAPIVSTPYTIEVLRSILWDEHLELSNDIITVPLNKTHKFSEKISVEFVNVTHSIPHTAILVVHTPYGKVMYANDYKFDRTPVLGKKPNFERLAELEGVDILIINCLYAHAHRKCPSESVARVMLKDVMLNQNCEDRGMIVTTFSSHLARLKSIIEMDKKMNRKIVFIGRSLDKYVRAAERINLVHFTDDIIMVRHRDKINKIFRKMEKDGREKYLIVCTGHQGEKRAVLSRLMRGELDFKFRDGDIVVFSCRVIPVEVNKVNRERLENGLRAKNVRIFKDLHVSGHAALEDHRDMLELVKPKNIIPIHAENEKAQMLADFAKKIGFKKTFVAKDGERFSF
ncbi:TPA: ribonuclease J [Candidatus Woesearchaeota archaeon]|nr:ribonuclease J [Candidatus Woesearchaeota archaeon]